MDRIEEHEAECKRDDAGVSILSVSSVTLSDLFVQDDASSIAIAGDENDVGCFEGALDCQQIIGAGRATAFFGVGPQRRFT